MGNVILSNNNDDGVDRRGFLKCMAWAGTGVLWVMSGGVMKSFGLSQMIDKGTGTLKEGFKIPESEFSFVQISDSHIGFSKEANPDVVGTLQSAIGKINGLAAPPSFILHTGDLSHLSKPSEFDTLDQVLKSANTEKIFFVPGEHDVLNDDGKQYRERYGKGTKGAGWYSFDSHGVHFIGLVNVMNLKAGGMGSLGNAQLEWLEDDVESLSSSTPIVVFAHIPLWTVYPEWGWGTDDSAQALSYLKRFGSVTVLNGHIHQTLQKIEGNITFHTAMSTAFPQPHPGAAPAPGPMKVPAEKLRGLLGLAGVYYVENKHTLAVIDSPLDPMGGAPDEEKKDQEDNGDKKTSGRNEIRIDNFKFDPKELTVLRGATVVWINHDDVPHRIAATGGEFASQALDTDQRFSHTFEETGRYDYYCSMHPSMTGSIIVR